MGFDSEFEASNGTTEFIISDDEVDEYLLEEISSKSGLFSVSASFNEANEWESNDSDSVGSFLITNYRSDSSEEN